MAQRDYYEVLGVGKDADEAAMKKAYRRLAMKYHPDRNQDDPSAEESFKEAKEAYDVLSDSNKRATYDRFGHEGVRAQGGAGAASNAGFRDIFDEVFGDIFGQRAGGGGPQAAYRGADLRYGLELSLEKAVFGTTARIEVPRRKTCGACDGSGAKPGSAPVTCETCDGNGKVRMQQGFFSIQQTCPRCRGRGTTIKDPCRTCSGSGMEQERRKLEVKVPAGVDNGDRIRLTGEGEAGPRGGPPGDLYVEVQVEDHAVFERDGQNLYCELPVSFATAALGGEIQVPTLDGRVNLKVPSETQSGKLFRLRGKGVKALRGTGYGDLICRLTVETPVSLNSEQKKLLREFEASLEGSRKDHAPRQSSWIDSVKRFFDADGD